MIHFVSVGGNIEPRVHLAAALAALRGRFGRLHLSRVLETAPHEVDDPRPFLNVAVAFEAEVEPAALKAWCSALEVSRGRDRTDPERSRKARTLDLDPLFALEPGQDELAVALVPDEPYARPFVLDLARFLGLRCALEAPELPAGVALEVEGLTVGLRPTTLQSEVS